MVRNLTDLELFGFRIRAKDIKDSKDYAYQLWLTLPDLDSEIATTTTNYTMICEHQCPGQNTLPSAMKRDTTRRSSNDMTGNK